MRKSLIAVVYIAAIFSIAPFALSQIQTVKVTGGQLQGVVVDGVASFKGIPFAAPPVGDLRWKPPQPAKGWAGIKKADAFGPACMQAANSQGNTAPVSEDCLYLNVWTPATKASQKISP
jgi:para-nitrobenzyl esterase